MMRLLSFLTPKAPWIFVYMLQQFEYDAFKYLRWVVGLPNLFTAQKRGKLHMTARAKLTVLLVYGVWFGVLLSGIGLSILLENYTLLLVCMAAPVLTAGSLFIGSALLQILAVNPRYAREIRSARTKLEAMQAVKIAVLGSYGKTTMKELLASVLAEGKRVAATPGNKNVLISHARWVNQLAGDEEVLIFEYGEGAPGDIALLANFSKPDYAVVTGLAPAHLDRYPTLEAIADDFASIKQFVDVKNVLVHDDSELLHQKLTECTFYSTEGVDTWSVQDVVVGFDGTEFTLKADTNLTLRTGLLGVHQIGPLTAVVRIARQLGLSNEQIARGVLATKPYEHRMQARALHGAWVIDDTYNGNIQGMRAGLELLKTLPGSKKIYVTPGLVDQGVENERVHTELGELIAQASPDKVVLMQNSNTAFIQRGLDTQGYTGELIIESNPLEYYTNLEHYLAAGDVVLMQNDLPDSYK